MKQDRKIDHLALAASSQISSVLGDKRFAYEPLFACHPTSTTSLACDFGPWKLGAPLWISSMTGGTALAKKINYNLARVAGDFGLGMGLGSCRSLLGSNEHLSDFQVKSMMPSSPLLANFGLAQVEQEFCQYQNFDRILRVVDILQADGLIIHINPLQEWFQQGGDRFKVPPLEVLEQLIERVDVPVIIKEVGQGFGPKSLQALMRLPLVAIEFAAFGGTNFSQLELLRRGNKSNPLCFVGHDAEEMVEFVNNILKENPQEKLVNNFIISGGIKTFLDGFYLCQKLNACAIYGQAKIVLDHASKGYDSLASFVEEQLKGYACATAFLKVKG